MFYTSSIELSRYMRNLEWEPLDARTIKFTVRPEKGSPYSFIMNKNTGIGGAEFDDDEQIVRRDIEHTIEKNKVRELVKTQDH